ncbi:MAG: hypothetical protein ABIB43_00765 [archaeon]
MKQNITLTEPLSVDEIVAKFFNNLPITCISPHYDELPLCIGGSALALQDKLEIKNVNVFSKSQYVSPEYESKLQEQLFEEGNSDIFSKERIQFVSPLRRTEDDNCLESLGVNSRIYLEKNEAPLRGYGLGDGKEGITFPTAPENWWKNPEEEILLNNLKIEFKEYMSEKNNVFIPIGIKYHIDHVLVRRAAISAANELNNSGKLNANLFFYEDQPYAGLSAIKSNDWIDANRIIANCASTDIVIDLQKKISLIDFYTSQLEDGYSMGIENRAIEIGNMDLSGKIQPIERIYKLNTAKIHELTKLDNFKQQNS